MLAEPWQAKFQESTLPSNPTVCSYRGLNRKREISYLCTESGFTVAAPDIVSNLKIFRVVVAGLLEVDTILPPFEGAGTALLIQPEANVGTKSIERFGKQHLGAPGHPSSLWGRVDGVRIYLHQYAWERWKAKLVGRLGKMKIDCRYEDWMAVEVGICGQRSTTLESLATWAETNSTIKDAIIKPAFAEYHLAPNRIPPFSETPFFGCYMAEMIGGLTIPYNKAKRKIQFPRAFEQLAGYIEGHSRYSQKDRSRIG
jgi:hypothetical protein